MSSFRTEFSTTRLKALSDKEVNNFGEKPSPCGTPLFVLNFRPIFFPILTLIVVFVYSSSGRLQFVMIV